MSAPPGSLSTDRAPYGRSVVRGRAATPRPRGRRDERANDDREVVREAGVGVGTTAVSGWHDDRATALVGAVAEIPHEEWLAVGRALLARGLTEQEQRARAHVDALCAAHHLAYTAWLVRDAVETGESVGHRGSRRSAPRWTAWRARFATQAARTAAREAATYAALAVLLHRHLPASDVRRLRAAFDVRRRHPERAGL